MQIFATFFLLQDEQLAKDQSRALAMHQRFEERTAKFLYSKQRTIGVDKQSLDEQLEEKKHQMEDMKLEETKEGKLFPPLFVW